jgi:hypothetical protein
MDKNRFHTDFFAPQGLFHVLDRLLDIRLLVRHGVEVVTQEGRSGKGRVGGSARGKTAS